MTSCYERFGFTGLGVSNSVHDGEVWHDVTLKSRHRCPNKDMTVSLFQW